MHGLRIAVLSEDVSGLESNGGAMGRRLVTIATFDQAAQARLAKNVLDEAGIQSAVNDEQLVAMDWLLSNAVGGVKVQVWEEDAERAVSVLEGELGPKGEGVGAAASLEELAAEAEATTPDEGEEVEPAPPAPETPEPPPSPDSRDEFARRSVFTAIVGLLVIPVGIYFPLLDAAGGEGELSQRGRLNLLIASLITASSLGWLFLHFRLMALS
jgi:hypothetical protein